jgi:hypothetical protein
VTASGDILGGGEPLLARVRAEAAGTTRIRFALGYLFLPGLAPVWDALDASGGEIHLLIGNTAGLPTDEQRIAGQDAGSLTPALDVAAHARAERARVVAEIRDALRANLAHLPHTGDNARLLLALARGIAANRVRVRIYSEGRLHAKAYLFERPAGGRVSSAGQPFADDTRPEAAVALVGSSNLSLPSPGNPTELNVVVRDAAGVGAVSAWFDSLWGASHDFSRDLFTQLSASWPLSAPGHAPL